MSSTIRTKVALRSATPPIEIIEDVSFDALRERYVAALRAMRRRDRRKEILQLMRDVEMELRALGGF